VGFVFDADDVTRQFPQTADGEVPVELELFDSVAREPARLSGDTVRIHPLRGAKHRHPLYKEASDGGGPAYDESYEIPAALEYMRESATSASATDAALTFADEAYLWIARKEIDDQGKNLPKVGDVVEFWSYQPMGDVKSQSYWDVTLAPTLGDLWSQATYTMIKLTIKRRTDFPASEKVIKRT
jgi:hypothetical protein